MIKKLLSHLGIDFRSNEEIQELVTPNTIPENPELPPEEQPTQEKEKPANIAMVNFAVSDAGQVQIHINWTNYSAALAEALGLMLYAINNGKFQEKCRDILEQSTIENPNSRQPIKQILDFWDAAEKKHTPLVKPSEVFQLGRQKIRDTSRRGTHEVQEGEVE